MLTREDFKKAIETRVFVKQGPNVRIANRGADGESAWLFDFRAIMLEARWLNFFAEAFWERFGSRYPFQVGGLETAGIPLVAAIVMKGLEKGKPVNGFFIRKSRKRDGLMKTIEGTLTNDPIVLVDDIINSGGTFNRQIEVLRDADKKVSGIFSILAYREKEAYGFARDQNIELVSLFTLKDFGLPLLSSKAAEIPRLTFDALWRFKAEHPSFNFVVQKSAPIVDERAVYFGTDGGVFFALDQENGKVLWHYKVGLHPKGKGIFSTPALHGNLVYFGAYDGNVYALEKTTGKRRWVFMEADWVGSSPALAPDIGLLFIGLEFGLFRKKGGIAALSLDKGKKVWDHRMPEYTHATPQYLKEERAVVIGGNEQTVYLFDAKSGERRWSFKTAGDVKSSFAYDSKRRLILFGDLGSRFYALSAKTGTLVFTHTMGAGMYSTPLVDGNLVYAASLDKNVYAIDLSTGKVVWHYATGGRIFSSPRLAEDSLWIGSNDGRLHELDPKSGKLRSFFQASERITNAIAYNGATKRFFVPTVANEIYCLKRRA